jgi:hypothetical protein
MPTDETDNREAVIVRLKLSDDEFGEWHEREAAYAIEDRLRQALEVGDVGELEGHEFGAGFATVYLYGPSADLLAKVVLSSLSGTGHRAGSVLIKRLGPPGSREEVLPLVEGAA